MNDATFNPNSPIGAKRVVQVRGGYRVRELVGEHKGQGLTIDWPDLYATEAGALGAIQAMRLRLGHNGSTR